MKLYTEEQVRQMLSIYMANILLDVDGKMPTVDEILSYRTPIELPSDEEIEESETNSEYDRIDEYNYGFIDGANWVKNFILNKNK